MYFLCDFFGRIIGKYRTGSLEDNASFVIVFINIMYSNTAFFFTGSNHSLVNISNPSAEEGSVLVIRDSYAHCFSTFLAANYQSIYLVDLRYYRDALTKFVSEHRVDKILYLYGVDNLVSDTNSAWLK